MRYVYLCRYDNGEVWSDHHEWNGNIYVTVEEAVKEIKSLGYSKKDELSDYFKENGVVIRLKSPDSDEILNCGYGEVIKMLVYDTFVEEVE